MGGYLIYNGNLVPVSEFGISPANRSFRYGDGFFETIRCQSGVALWVDYHIQRIAKSASVLKMALPTGLKIKYLASQINELLQVNGCLNGARLRLSVFREDGGHYTPVQNNASYILEVFTLDNEGYELNKTGLNAGFFRDMEKSCNTLSFIKSSSALLYVMAGLYAREQGWDEAIILNNHGFVAEALSSNIFMVSGGCIYTPALDQGCVDGIFRKLILDVAVKNGFKLQECAILPEDILLADEVFITNTIRGIQWIKGIENKRYFHSMSSQLTTLVNSEATLYLNTYRKS